MTKTALPKSIEILKELPILTSYYKLKRELTKEQWLLLNYVNRHNNKGIIKITIETLVSDCDYFKDYTEQDFNLLLKEIFKNYFVFRKQDDKYLERLPVIWMGMINKGEITILLNSNRNSPFFELIFSSLIDDKVIKNIHDIRLLKIVDVLRNYDGTNLEKGLSFTYQELKNYFGISVRKHEDVEKVFKMMFEELNNATGSLLDDIAIIPYLNNNKKNGLTLIKEETKKDD